MPIRKDNEPIVNIIKGSTVYKEVRKGTNLI